MREKTSNTWPKYAHVPNCTKICSLVWGCKTLHRRQTDIISKTTFDLGDLKTDIPEKLDTRLSTNHVTLSILRLCQEEQKETEIGNGSIYVY